MCHFDDISNIEIVLDELVPEVLDSEIRLRETCDDETSFDDPHDHDEK